MGVESSTAVQQQYSTYQYQDRKVTVWGYAAGAGSEGWGGEAAAASVVH
jgi:hypothetical protein